MKLGVGRRLCCFELKRTVGDQFLSVPNPVLVHVFLKRLDHQVYEWCPKDSQQTTLNRFDCTLTNVCNKEPPSFTPVCIHNRPVKS